MAIHIPKIEIERDKVAFEGDKRGYYFRATYLKKPDGKALVEITKNGEIVREFLFPSYKIWNISAHADYIISGLDAGNDSGLYIAGSDGLGGNDYVK